MLRRRRRCRRSPFSNIYISKTYRPNANKFYLKHHWVVGKTASGFKPDQIRTRVSMATAPIGLLWKKWRRHVFSKVFDWILFILAGHDDKHKSLNKFEIQPDRLRSKLPLSV